MKALTMGLGVPVALHVLPPIEEVFSRWLVSYLGPRQRHENVLARGGGLVHS